MTNDFGHVPVLAAEVDELLDLHEGDTVLDATLGAAGHALRICQSIGDTGRLIGLDVDPDNLKRASERLADAPGRHDLVLANFKDAPNVLRELDAPPLDAILADLGISSTQLDDPARGLSFREDGPLDMRLDPSLAESAADLINRLPEKEISDILYFNSQEMKSRRIAKRICEARRERRITTTAQLSRIVCKALGVADPNSRRAKIHPATRTFQALRMAVNGEKDALDALLEAAPTLLGPGGRIAVIAFHSVEDKPVKLNFRKNKVDGLYEIVTKKPIIAGEDERRSNPRSRSAKLRVARRLPDEHERG